MRSDRAPDLMRCSHGLDIGVKCGDCTNEGLKNVDARQASQKRCKGCDNPVGPWVDYCGECSCEDEDDCW